MKIMSDNKPSFQQVVNEPVRNRGKQPMQDKKESNPGKEITGNVHNEAEKLARKTARIERYLKSAPTIPALPHPKKK